MGSDDKSYQGKAKKSEYFVQNTRQAAAWHFNSLKMVSVAKTRKAKGREEMG